MLSHLFTVAIALFFFVGPCFAETSSDFEGTARDKDVLKAIPDMIADGVTSVTFRQSGIGDSTLKALSKVPTITSIQLLRGNRSTYTAEGIRSLASLPSLQSFWIFAGEELDEDTAEALAALPHLKELSFAYAYLNDAVAKKFEKHPTLEKIYDAEFQGGSSKGGLSDVGARSLATLPKLSLLRFGVYEEVNLSAEGLNALGTAPTLTDLSLGENSHPSGTSIWKSVGTSGEFANLQNLTIGVGHSSAELASAIAKFPGLRRLRLGFNAQLGPEVKFLSSAPALETLILPYGEEMGAAGWKELAKIKTLRTLYIAAANVGSKAHGLSVSSKELGEAFSSMPHLEALTLSSSMGSMDRNVCDAVSKLKGLKNLEIRMWSFKDLSFLSELVKLQKLQLYLVNTQEFPLGQLKVLSSLTDLEALDLTRVSIDEQDAEKFVELLAPLKKLSYLGTDEIPLREEELKALAKQLPGIQNLVLLSPVLGARDAKALLDFKDLKKAALALPVSDLPKGVLFPLINREVSLIDHLENPEEVHSLKREILSSTGIVEFEMPAMRRGR